MFINNLNLAKVEHLFERLTYPYNIYCFKINGELCSEELVLIAFLNKQFRLNIRVHKYQAFIGYRTQITFFETKSKAEFKNICFKDIEKDFIKHYKKIQNNRLLSIIGFICFMIICLIIYKGTMNG